MEDREVKKQSYFVAFASIRFTLHFHLMFRWTPLVKTWVKMLWFELRRNLSIQKRTFFPPQMNLPVWSLTNGAFICLVYQAWNWDSSTFCWISFDQGTWWKSTRTLKWLRWGLTWWSLLGSSSHEPPYLRIATAIEAATKACHSFSKTHFDFLHSQPSD